MQAEQEDFVVDDYEAAESCASVVRRKTGVIFDDYNTKHKNEWDPTHPECPERYLCVIKRYVHCNICFGFCRNRFCCLIQFLGNKYVTAFLFIIVL